MQLCVFVVVDTSSYDCDKVDVFSMKMMLAASKREIRCTYLSDLLEIQLNVLALCSYFGGGNDGYR